MSTLTEEELSIAENAAMELTDGRVTGYSEDFHFITDAIEEIVAQRETGLVPAPKPDAIDVLLETDPTSEFSMNLRAWKDRERAAVYDQVVEWVRFITETEQNYPNAMPGALAEALVAHEAKYLRRGRSQALAPVLELHRRRPWNVSDSVIFGQTEFPDLCGHCRITWPCATATVLLEA